jgi:hypothetical protein
MQSTTYLNERMQYIFQSQSKVQSHRDQNRARIFVVLDHLQEISSLELVTSQRKNVTRGVHPGFVYQYASLDYYEPVEHCEVDVTLMLMCVGRLKKINQIF